MPSNTSPTGGRSYTYKAKYERPPVGIISVEAIRMANIICTHEFADTFPCKDCQNECQATLNAKAR